MSKQNDAARLVLVLLVLLVVFLVGRAGSRYFGAKESVWVAQADLSRGELVSLAQIQQHKLATAQAPAAPLAQSEIVGKKLNRDKKKGEPFVSGDFALPTVKSIAERIPEGRVLYTLRISGAALPYRDLRVGDRLDILSLSPTDPKLKTSRATVIAHDAIFIGSLGGTESVPEKKKPSPLLPLGLRVEPSRSRGDTGGVPPLALAVFPEDVFGLAEVSPGSIRIVIQRTAKGEDGQRTPMVVDLSRPPDVKTVELVLGTERSVVAFQ